jgi:hypothetical protein
MKLESPKLFGGLAIATCLLRAFLAWDTLMAISSGRFHEGNPIIVTYFSPPLWVAIFLPLILVLYLTWRFVHKRISAIGMAIAFGMVMLNAIEHILVRL